MRIFIIRACVGAAGVFGAIFLGLPVAADPPGTAQIDPPGRIATSGPPDMGERIAARYPDGIAPIPDEVRERADALRTLRAETAVAIRDGDPEGGWQLVRDHFDNPANPLAAELAALRMLMYLGHRAQRRGERDETDAVIAFVQERLEGRLHDPALGARDIGTRAERAKWMLILGHAHHRLLNRPAEAALLYDEARRLDPSSRQGTWALQRLGRTQGRAGYRAYEALIPEIQSVSPRVRALLQEIDDE